MTNTQTVGSLNLGSNPKNKWMGLISFILVSIAALMVTVGLIALMHSLIYQEFEEPTEDPAPPMGNIHLEEMEIETIKFVKPEKIVDPAIAPKQIVEKLIIDTDEGAVVIPIKIDPIMHGGPVIDFSGSGSLVKRVVAPPVYPRRASAKGIEGYVDLMFDVTATGAVKNIRITAAQPVGVFEKSAMAAIKKYKYKPQKIDGESIATPNVQERIRYQMEK